MKHITRDSTFKSSKCGASFNLKNRNSFELYKLNDFVHQLAVMSEHCCSKCIAVLASKLKEQGLPELPEYIEQYKNKHNMK
jgi:hypothetical protein